MLTLLDLTFLGVQDVELFVQAVLALSEAAFGDLELVTRFGGFPLETVHHLQELLLGLDFRAFEKLLAPLPGFGEF